MNAKATNYLKQNPAVEKFVKKLLQMKMEYNAKAAEKHGIPMPRLVMDVSIGTKFIKITFNDTVWGFISRYDGHYKGAPVKRGDLMLPASFNAPAKHSRGNIIDGTASYGLYGPDYRIGR
jgi:hypothetical protein